MTIDIIIACLGDGGGYLKDCLSSISAQAFKDVNVILEKDDPEAPLGVAAMRNRGLEKTVSDYVMFMDCDDYLGQNALTAAAYEALKNPGSIVRINRKRTFFRYSTTIAIEDKEYLERRRSERLMPADMPAGADPEQPGTEQDEAEKVIGTNPDNVFRNGLPKSFYDTCLGQLIPRSLLEGLRFEENYRYYSDIPFLAQLYERTDVAVVPEASYYKRIRNDIEKNPSLDQERNQKRFPEYCDAMRLAAGYMSDPGLICSYVCQFIVSRTVVGRRPKALNWSDKDLRNFASFVADVAYPAIPSFKGESRKILKAFRSENIRRIRRVIKWHSRRMLLHDLTKSAHQRRLLIYRKVFRKLPVKKDTVLFSAFFGRNYCDSPRAIYEYMLEKYPKKKYIWLMNDDKAEIPGDPVRIHTGSLKYYYWLAVAETYINNVRQPEWYEKLQGTRFLQTWHGTPLKRLVCDLEDVYAAKPVQYKKEFCRQAAEWDMLISDNAFSSEAFSTAFRYPKEKMLEVGYPRNDILYAPDREERAKNLKKKLGLPTDKKIVLYAPTWRDDEAEGAGEYGFSLKLELRRMKKLSGRYHFILRTHYLISENLQLTEDEKRFVTDLSKYGDIAELYLITDVLITDYSSVFFDFANLRRPILFYVYDMDKYRDELHGFYFDMENECPGPLLYNTDQVAEALGALDRISAEYAPKYEAFCDKYCYLDDGNAAGRVVEQLYSDNISE